MSTAEDRAGILSVGRIYCDIIFTDVPRMPTLGTEVFVGGSGLHAGGGAYITAAYFAALGHATSLAGFLPAAPFDDLVLAEIRAAGVDPGLCQPAQPGQDPQITVALVADGDRSFVTRRSGPPIPSLEAVVIRAAGVRHVHIGELRTLVECPALVAAARDAGATISLDCGWDETLEAQGMAGLISEVDVFLPNETEARHLTRLGLAEPFAPLTVVKRGSEGATAFVNGSEIREPTVAIAAVDTTGAGDAFNAGFLSAWLGGRPIGLCLAEGNAMGARAIKGRGGFRSADSGSRTASADQVAG